jgi:hypothetical protein
MAMMQWHIMNFDKIDLISCLLIGYLGVEFKLREPSAQAMLDLEVQEVSCPPSFGCLKYTYCSTLTADCCAPRSCEPAFIWPEGLTASPSFFTHASRDSLMKAPCGCSCSLVLCAHV